MIKITFKFILFIFLVLSGISVFAQTKTKELDTLKNYQIKLIDGTSFIGKFIRMDSSVLVFKTASLPKIEIPSSKIKSIDILNSYQKNGEYFFPNPNTTRYFIGPSAFNLKKGEGYYQNTYLIFNSFNYGITDNISMGGGFEFISTFVSLTTGNFAPIFYLTPKVGFQVKENINLGGGLIYASIPFSNIRHGLGVAYGISTLGSVDNNISFGMGWGFIEDKFSSNPIYTISATTRLYKEIALVTENWIIPTDNYNILFSYGIRFFGEKVSVDLAFMNNELIAKSIFIGIPYIDFVVKF